MGPQPIECPRPRSRSGTHLLRREVEPMKAIRGTFGAAAACLILGMLGCDQSKTELEQTKAQLQTVSGERDALKNQVSGMQQQISALTQQLGEANAKLAAAAQPAAQAQPPAAAHHRARPATGSTSGSSQAAEPAQPLQPTPAQLEQKAAEKQMTGKASM